MKECLNEFICITYVWVVSWLYLGPPSNAPGDYAPKKDWVKHERVLPFRTKEECEDHYNYLNRNPIWRERLLIVVPCQKVQNNFKETLH